MKCRTALQKAQPLLEDQVYEDLSRRFNLWRHCAHTWRAFAKAFFAYRIFEEQGDPEMLNRAKRAVINLESWADLTAEEFGEDIMRNNPERTRRFVRQLREKIHAIEQDKQGL